MKRFDESDLAAMRFLAWRLFCNLYFATLHLMFVYILWSGPRGSESELPPWFSAATFMVIGWPIAAIFSVRPFLNLPIYLVTAHAFFSLP